MRYSIRHHVSRRGAIVLQALPRRRAERAAHEHGSADALDVPYWFSHSGRVRRRSARLTHRHTHRLRGRSGGI